MNAARETDFPDRVRFNWGYHDAGTESGWGRARKLVAGGPQTERTVSPDFDRAFADGYREGLSDVAEGRYSENSTEAWLRVGLRAYEAALDTYRAASREHTRATLAYRTRKLDDPTFLVARRAFDAAQAACDAAEVRYLAHQVAA